MRNKLVTDVKMGRKSGRTNEVSEIVNLQYARLWRVQIRYVSFFVLVAIFFGGFFLNFVFAPTSGDVKAAQSVSAEERRELENQLAELEKQMGEYESKISEYKKQGTTLQSEIKILNGKIAKIKLQVQAITLTLQKINRELTETEEQIGVTISKTEQKKKIIAQIIQNIYQEEKKGTILLLLAHNQISDFFNEISHLSSIQDGLRINVEELSVLHVQLSDQKEFLALEKADIASLRAYQETQMQNIAKTKAEADNLLAVTKGKESEYKKVLAETQKTAAEIRNRLFEMLGGGALKFEDAYEYAKFAESKTGVRAALILAVLDRESALGRNVGQCEYKTAMHPTRDIPAFLKITKELGLNPDALKVSCPIVADGAYGGAMGPAQFIPSTWIGYKDQIAAMTGNNPPSPWNNLDAFMGTALYLKNSGAAGGTIADERAAAAKYYAGSRWRNYLWTYGERVITRAQEFQKDINTLNA